MTQISGAKIEPFPRLVAVHPRIHGDVNGDVYGTSASTAMPTQMMSS